MRVRDTERMLDLPADDMAASKRALGPQLIYVDIRESGCWSGCACATSWLNADRTVALQMESQFCVPEVRRSLFRPLYSFNRPRRIR
jgi:hypothetical protein